MFHLSSTASRKHPAIGLYDQYSHRFAQVSKGALVCLIFVFGSQVQYAQSSAAKYDSATYKEQPVWIEMMHDPGANFYETVKAFREYWEGYELPGEPEVLEQNGRFKRDIGLKPDKVITRDTTPQRPLPKRTDANGNEFLFEVKQFKGWYRDAQAWVQKDGHVLTLEERQQIIEQQQKERRAIESNQKRQ